MRNVVFISKSSIILTNLSSICDLAEISFKILMHKIYSSFSLEKYLRNMRFKQQFPFVLHLLLSRRNNWDIKDVSLFSRLLRHVGWSSAEDTEPWNKKKDNTSTPSTVYNGFNRKDQSSNSSKCHPITDYTTVPKPSQAKMIVARPVKRLLRSPGFLCSLKDWQADTGPGDRFSRNPLGGETAVHWQSSVPRLHAPSLCASLQLFYSGLSDSFLNWIQTWFITPNHQSKCLNAFPFSPNICYQTGKHSTSNGHDCFSCYLLERAKETGSGGWGREWRSRETRGDFGWE